MIKYSCPIGKRKICKDIRNMSYNNFRNYVERKKFIRITKKHTITEKEEDYLGRYIVKSPTPVQEFLAVPPRLRSSLLCELAYLRSTTAKERIDVANGTPTHAMKGISICPYILKLVNKDYQNADYINYDVLRAAVARRDEIHSEGFNETLSKGERERIEKNYECALRAKVSIYTQLVDRRTMLNHAKGAPTTGIEEELEIVNAKIDMLEEEGISGYIDELSALTAAREAARLEEDRLATEKAEQIMAIAEEVRAEKESKPTAKATRSAPRTITTVDTDENNDIPDLV